MSKKSTVKSPMTRRVRTPKIVKDKEGNALIMCPFCDPPHPLSTNGFSKCGTTLLVTAEQVVVRAKFDKSFVCVKCGQGGGEMVQFQEGFIHTHDCAPGVVAMTNPPKYSIAATMVNGLKFKWLKSFIELFTGLAVPVQEVDTHGNKTGVILGYFFLKEEKNAKRAPIIS